MPRIYGAAEIDRVSARHAGFTTQTPGSIIHDDIKYRMGRDGLAAGGAGAGAGTGGEDAEGEAAG